MSGKHARFIMTFLFFAAGCGPSAWTPTPIITPTATPIPYALTVHIADQAGIPIPGARILLRESGSDEPVFTDSQGTYTWPSINGPTANLEVSAPGFHPALQLVTLERGHNEMALILQRLG